MLKFNSSKATETLFFAVGDCVLRSLNAWSTRQLAELADAFARVKARHPLLLDVVPSRCHKAIPSIEALLLLFSAYVDLRQGFAAEETLQTSCQTSFLYVFLCFLFRSIYFLFVFELVVKGSP